MVQKYVFLFHFLILGTSINALGQQHEFSITCKCEGYPDQLVYISHINEESGTITDTIKLENQHFSHSKGLELEAWVQVRFQKKNGFIDLFTTPTERITLILKVEERLINPVIIGSPGSLDRHNYVRNRTDIGKQRRAILSQEENKRGSYVLDSLDALTELITYRSLLQTNHILLKEICLFGLSTSLYLGNIKHHIDSILFNYPKSINAMNLKKSYEIKAEEIKAKSDVVSIETFDFDYLISLEGDQITKKEIGGRYLFIEFWASWCQPCRISNGKININHEVFKDKNIYPLFVSIDQDQNKWKAAISQDKLEWANHALDFYDKEKSIAKQLKIVVIPTNFLIAPNGQIILQNATPEDVKAFLDKLK